MLVSLCNRVISPAGHYGGSINLMCIVDSLVPFSIRWFKGAIPITEEKTFL